VLYRPFSEAPKTLDPAVAYTTTAHDINGLVNVSLLEYHYLKRPYALAPGLARAVPVAERRGDRTAYRFELYPISVPDYPASPRTRGRRRSPHGARRQFRAALNADPA
jgi:hypothetical protein